MDLPTSSPSTRAPRSEDPISGRLGPAFRWGLNRTRAVCKLSLPGWGIGQDRFRRLQHCRKNFVPVEPSRRPPLARGNCLGKRTEPGLASSPRSECHHSHEEYPVSFLRRLLRLREGLWFIPLACVLAGVATSLGTIAIDQAYSYKLVPRSISGGPDAAIEVLGTIAASMVSLPALVLTITMVVVQLAMGQFSPRIVQRILQDKPSQVAIGVFVGTFAHAMLTLREVQADGEGRSSFSSIGSKFTDQLSSPATPASGAWCGRP